MTQRNKAALVAYLDERLNRPHDWDGNCCARFVLGAVEAQFGTAPKLRVTWDDERSALRAIAKVGGLEAETSRLFTYIDPAFAQFGDLAGVDDPVGGFMLAIVEGQTLVAPGDTGLVRRPRTAMRRAWSADPGRG